MNSWKHSVGSASWLSEKQKGINEQEWRTMNNDTDQKMNHNRKKHHAPQWTAMKQRLKISKWLYKILETILTMTVGVFADWCRDAANPKTSPNKWNCQIQECRLTELELLKPPSYNFLNINPLKKNKQYHIFFQAKPWDWLHFSWTPWSLQPSAAAMQRDGRLLRPKLPAGRSKQRPLGPQPPAPSATTWPMSL